mmetsp:Transcript_13047/g.19648  ORF Transcript_13047/g.19648 Transcript_13047/m.19648 type:complete len:285 (-) Transcript_13047:76-930(-)
MSPDLRAPTTINGTPPGHIGRIVFITTEIVAASLIVRILVGTASGTFSSTATELGPAHVTRILTVSIVCDNDAVAPCVILWDRLSLLKETLRRVAMQLGSAHIARATRTVRVDSNDRSSLVVIEGLNPWSSGRSTSQSTSVKDVAATVRVIVEVLSTVTKVGVAITRIPETMCEGAVSGNREGNVQSGDSLVEHVRHVRWASMVIHVVHDEECVIGRDVAAPTFRCPLIVDDGETGRPTAKLVVIAIEVGRVKASVVLVWDEHEVGCKLLRGIVEDAMRSSHND